MAGFLSSLGQALPYALPMALGTALGGAGVGLAAGAEGVGAGAQAQQRTLGPILELMKMQQAQQYRQAQLGLKQESIGIEAQKADTYADSVAGTANYRQKLQQEHDYDRTHPTTYQNQVLGLDKQKLAATWAQVNSTDALRKVEASNILQNMGIKGTAEQQKQQAIASLDPDLRTVAGAGPQGLSLALKLQEGRVQHKEIDGQLDTMMNDPNLSPQMKQNIPTIRNIVNLAPGMIGPRDMTDLLVMDPAKLKGLQDKAALDVKSLETKDLQNQLLKQKVEGRTPMTVKDVAALNANIDGQAMRMASHDFSTIHKHPILWSDKQQHNWLIKRARTYKGQMLMDVFGAKHGTKGGVPGYQLPDGTFKADSEL